MKRLLTSSHPSSGTCAEDDAQQAPLRRRKQGFTLIELLVVLAILGLIAAFAVPRVMKYLSSAKSQAAEIQIHNLATALDLYRLEAGRYPTTEEGLKALIEQPRGARFWNGPYLDKKDGIIDPWGRPYLYKSPGEHGSYDLWTLGADGKPGGEGENRDIANWDTAAG